MQIRTNQQGNMDPLMIPLILSVVLVVGLGGFGVWAYLGFLDQKNNTDDKIAVAVEEARAIQAEELEDEFNDREKSPTASFTSSNAIGSINLEYPKTWSGFVEENDSGSEPLDGFFHPRYVPAKDTNYALRINVDESNYAREVASYDKEIEDGEVRSRPITIEGQTGIRLDGQIDSKYSGAMVIFPLRDKTIKIWTESNQYVDDFNDIVIKNLTFSP